MSLVQTLPQNHRGRTFAIGDVHGAFDLILRAMDLANFDQSVDIIIGNGDYINRGPHSYRAARFLRSSFVKGVRGNHEQNLLDLFENGYPEQAVIDFFANRNFNGMGWMSSVKPEILQDIVDEVKKLPIVIETVTDRGTVGFVHGDVPKGMNWDTFKKKILDGDAQTTQCALEGRNRLKSNDESGVDGVGRLFVGHSIQEGGLRKLGNVVAIDTGAIFGQMYSEGDGHLSMVNLNMCTQALMLPKLPGLIDLRDCLEAPSQPFSKYSTRPR